MILTRMPVIAVRRHALPWPADPGKESMPRVAIEATLQLPLGPVRVTTTHLEYYSPVQRAAQAARLRELHDEACDRAARPGFPTAENGPFDLTAQTPVGHPHGGLQFPARESRVRRDPEGRSRAAGPPIATPGRS